MPSSQPHHGLTPFVKYHRLEHPFCTLLLDSMATETAIELLTTSVMLCSQIGLQHSCIQHREGDVSPEEPSRFHSVDMFQRHMQYCLASHNGCCAPFWKVLKLTAASVLQDHSMACDLACGTVERAIYLAT
jgi:hypothetical protein